MKKITIIATAIFWASILNATTLTVCNIPASVAQYNTLADAINAATAGDTLLVQGSPTSYGAFQLEKKLVLIGPGFSPDKQFGFTAVISGQGNFQLGSAGSELQGFTGVSITLYIYVDNIRIIRNRFNSGSLGCISGNGFLFEGNDFNSSKIAFNETGVYSNILIQNNLFNDRGNNASLSNLNNCTNVHINHNLFTGIPIQQTFSGNCRALNITNNIFVNSNASGVSGSTFSNNITYNCGNNAPWTGNGNTSTGNIENQNPRMVDQNIVNAGDDNATANYTIATGPANNSASDGKDMGLLFDLTGSLNWTNSRTSRLPFIKSMNITNPTVAAGATISVTIEANTGN